MHRRLQTNDLKFGQISCRQGTPGNYGQKNQKENEMKALLVYYQAFLQKKLILNGRTT
jgi:hypothetical protein